MLKSISKMDLQKVTEALQYGVSVSPESNETMFAAVVANHLSAFRVRFENSIDLYAVKLVNVRDGETVEVRGGAHPSFVPIIQQVDALRPHHAALTRGQHARAFARLEKGGHRVVLQEAGPIPVEMIIERRDTSRPDPGPDAEDKARATENALKFVQLHADLVSIRRREGR